MAPQPISTLAGEMPDRAEGGKGEAFTWTALTFENRSSDLHYCMIQNGFRVIHYREFALSPIVLSLK